MENWKFLFSFFFLTFFLGCGELTTEVTPPAPAENEPAEEATVATDPNHPTGNTAIVLGANFTDPIGTVNTLTIDPPRTAQTNLATTHSDAMVRSFGNRVYVINRLGADNIQVIDPTDFSTLYQFSTGNGTNPQDIFVPSPTKAYVTLYQPEDNRSPNMTVDDLLVFDPTTGHILQTIDLTPYTRNDGDRFARASSMLLIGDYLYIAVQDMPGDLSKPPDQPGKLVRLDTRTDQIDHALVLTGYDPFTMTTSPETGKIYLGCADFFDLNSPYGGIEVVDPTTMRSEGIYLDDAVLGGWIGDLDVSGNKGYVVLGLPDFSENRVVRFSLDPSAPEITILYRSPGYLQDIAIDENGLLLIGERDPNRNGVVFLDPASGAVIDGPINLGSPPASITFVER